LIKNQVIGLKDGQRNWVDISQKKIYKWLTRIWSVW
jgi:hypothetical protein